MINNGYLGYGDMVAREVSRRAGGSFATTADLAALPPTRRVGGMICTCENYVWVFFAGNEDAASAICLVPDDVSTNPGRWKAAVSLSVATGIDGIVFDEVATPAYTPGYLYFNDGYLSLMTGVGGTEMRIGDEMQRDAYNGSASTLTDGSPVYLHSANTQRVDVRPAMNDTTTGRAVGLTTQSIGSHLTGRVTTYGEVHGLDTHDWDEGTFLYTSSVEGGLTDVPVPGDMAGSRVAMVMVSHPNQGVLLVDLEYMARIAGTTANRPTAPRLGEPYFDTTGTAPTWYNGTGWQYARLPSSYIELASPVGTTSETLVDVTSMTTTVTLIAPAFVAVNVSFELQTQSGASASTIAVAINIDGTDHDEYSRYLSGTNDQGIGAITHRSAAEMAAGTHTVTLRYRRVSGVSTPGINQADMLVWAL